MRTSVKSTPLDVRPQALQEERTRCGYTMVNINQRLQEIFGLAIRTSFPELENPPLALAPNQQPKFGDYQCNSAMAMAQVRPSVHAPQPGITWSLVLDTNVAWCKDLGICLFLCQLLTCGASDAEGKGDESQPERHRREDHQEPSRQRAHPENRDRRTR